MGRIVALVLGLLPPVASAQVDVNQALVHIRYASIGNAECDCSGTGFFIDVTQRLFMTARHVWRATGTLQTLDCARYPKQLSYRTATGEIWRGPATQQPVWESKQEDLVIIRLDDGAPPPRAALRISTQFREDCVWKASVSGYPKCALQHRTPYANPHHQKYTAGDTSIDDEFALHFIGAQRNLYDLTAQYPDPGHSGAPIVIPGTDVVVGVVLHRGETSQAITGTSLSNLVASTGFEDRSPVSMFQLTPIDVPLTCEAPYMPPAKPSLQPEQRQRFREMVKHVANGLLMSFRCEWLKFGASLANVACNNKPCSPQELWLLYNSKQIKTLLSQPQLCEAVRSELIQMSLEADAQLDLRCTAPGSWGRTYGGWLVSDVNGPLKAAALSSSAKKKAFKAYAAEVALVQELLFNRIPRGSVHREEVILNIIESWAGQATEAGAEFYAAGIAWNALRVECPDCQMPLAQIDSRSQWYQVVSAILDDWARYMVVLPTGVNELPTFYPGCSDLVVRYSEEKWEIDTQSPVCDSLNCMRFGDSENTGALADRFATMLVP
ncbi:hypothetical protein [Corallococcus exercitus]|uniref:Serine protease n=1 Tax=Corallococcus exercitus TaxID=2316736 RepID=A0A7Y4JP22_9BACT|nr:hypothetical protein [Corallococcus exercitus]NOK08554.1 hypothetical protein [Corallococcus exercitus]